MPEVTLPAYPNTLPPPVIAGVQGRDVSTELYRVYTFPNGHTVRVDEPVTLYVTHHEGGKDSHRIARANGNGVYIPQGWLSIEWKPKPGKPAVSF